MGLNRVRTHDENRQIICLLCFVKGIRLNNITNSLETRIKEILKTYDLSNDFLPRVICDSCKQNLYKKKNSSVTRLFFM